jgi:tol-pal system protein YbgF
MQFPNLFVRIFKMLGHFSLSSLFAACMALSTSANAGLFDDDEARKAILELRQRLDVARAASEAGLAAQTRQTEELRKAQDDARKQAIEQLATQLSMQQAEQISVLKRSLLDLQNQIETLRADLARLRGQDEQLARDVSDIQRRQKDISQGIDDRIRKFEPVKVSLDGKEFSVEPNEKRDYEAALAVFRKGDFAASAPIWIDFIKRYPQSGYNPSAYFWLGNAQYATRDYKESITNFRSMVAASPDHPKAAEAVLSIANCQIELKDTRAARKTLEDLIKAYPQSEAAVAAKDRLSKLR